MPKQLSTTEELPSDNAARLTIYDAFAAPNANRRPRRTVMSEEELLELVIDRLRLLVPRELYVATSDLDYLREKIKACEEAGILERVGSPPGVLRLSGPPPRIRYPDGTIRDYTAGLEGARERLERCDARLRARNFDVHRLVPTMSKRSAAYKALVASMREHGFLYPIQQGQDGMPVDGKARVAAATEAGVKILSTTLPVRRDKPLYRALLVVDTNRHRLSEEQVDAVHAEIAAMTELTWAEVEHDLRATQEWRRAEPKIDKYFGRLEVELVPFRPDQEPKVQVTTDGEKVGLRSLVEAAGLSNYKTGNLRPYAPTMERAQTNMKGSRPWFVRVNDAIAGIDAMERDSAQEGRQFDREWLAIRLWLTEWQDQRQSRPDEVAENAESAPTEDLQQQLI